MDKKGYRDRHQRQQKKKCKGQVLLLFIGILDPSTHNERACVRPRCDSCRNVLTSIPNCAIHIVPMGYRWSSFWPSLVFSHLWLLDTDWNRAKDPEGTWLIMIALSTRENEEASSPRGSRCVLNCLFTFQGEKDKKKRTLRWQGERA
jgi:hypothetical protein